MARTIILKYQVKAEKPIFSNDSLERYELRELKHVCDPNKSDRENFDDAFCKACDLGANPNKRISWKYID